MREYARMKKSNFSRLSNESETETDEKNIPSYQENFPTNLTHNINKFSIFFDFFIYMRSIQSLLMKNEI